MALATPVTMIVGPMRKCINVSSQISFQTAFHKTDTQHPWIEYLKLQSSWGERKKKWMQRCSSIIMRLSSSSFLFCSLDQTSHPAQPPLSPRLPLRSPPGRLGALWPHACNYQSRLAAKESPGWRWDPWPWWRRGRKTQARSFIHSRRVKKGPRRCIYFLNTVLPLIMNI